MDSNTVQVTSTKRPDEGERSQYPIPYNYDDLVQKWASNCSPEDVKNYRCGVYPRPQGKLSMFDWGINSGYRNFLRSEYNNVLRHD